MPVFKRKDQLAVFQTGVEEDECPFCDTDLVEVSYGGINYDYGHWIQHVSCQGCGQSWELHYTLTRVDMAGPARYYDGMTPGAIPGEVMGDSADDEEEL